MDRNSTVPFFLIILFRQYIYQFLPVDKLDRIAYVDKDFPIIERGPYRHMQPD